MIAIFLVTMFMVASQPAPQSGQQTLEGIEPVPAEVEADVRANTYGDERLIGFTADELKSWRYPCRMPEFDGWLSDAFKFENEARRIGARFVSADGIAALLHAAWTVGGHEIDPDDGGEGSADEAPGKGIEPALTHLWERAGKEAPAGMITGRPDKLPEAVSAALEDFLLVLPSCRTAWNRAVEVIQVSEEDLETQALNYFRGKASKATVTLFEKRFDRAAAGRAAVDFAAAVEYLAAALKKSRLPARFEDLCLETPYGAVLIGARGGSEHGVEPPEAEPPLLLVDVSGDDIYLPSSACGRGNHPLCAVIDLRGDDVYASTSDAPGAGAGVGGVGIVVDLAGDDAYETASFGAGFGAVGAGIVHDIKGNDRYTGESVCQGAGLCGAGLVLDESGDDRYEVFIYGQGVGHPMGAGILVDRAGDDVYIARDDELRHPSAQTAEHNVSMSQGAGTGLRGDENRVYISGGFGLLLDHAGDDAYSGGVFAQSVGYWYGLGILFDLEGADTYHAVYYGQSASAHFALSYMLDADGDDDYRTTISQSLGNGRDLSISVFRDEFGDDTYFSPDRSLGCGDLDGIGLFIDSGGRDAYAFQTQVNCGLANFYEDHDETRQKMPTAGIFLDLGRGKDTYGREGPGNGKRWPSTGRYEGMRGFGLDDGPGGR